MKTTEMSHRRDGVTDSTRNKESLASVLVCLIFSWWLEVEEWEGHIGIEGCFLSNCLTASKGKDSPTRRQILDQGICN